MDVIMYYLLKNAIALKHFNQRYEYIHLYIVIIMLIAGLPLTLYHHLSLIHHPWHSTQYLYRADECKFVLVS